MVGMEPEPKLEPEPEFEPELRPETETELTDWRRITNLDQF